MSGRVVFGFSQPVGNAIQASGSAVLVAGTAQSGQAVAGVYAANTTQVIQAQISAVIPNLPLVAFAVSVVKVAGALAVDSAEVEVTASVVMVRGGAGLAISGALDA